MTAAPEQRTARPMAQTISSPEPEALLVDDISPNRRLLRQILARDGIRCVVAASAAEALEIIDRTPAIVLVVTDLMMPGTDGLALLARIRERFDKRPWIQVIVLTGYPSVETAVQCMRAGAANYLVKPVEPGLLVKIVKEALQTGHESRIVSSLSGVETDAANLAYLVATARELTAGNSSTPGKPAGSPEPAVVRSWLQAASPGETAPHALAQIRQLLDLRSQHFSDLELDDVAWKMLIELADASMQRRMYSVSSVCMASGAPSTTALRRLDDLVKAALVDRVTDPFDKRRTNVVLTPKGMDRMVDFLRKMARKGPGTLHRK
jgi:CheY-like chemotaxis protein/DNA-binding MarR family transcriptional regulator